jgi:hypothetical protein
MSFSRKIKLPGAPCFAPQKRADFDSSELTRLVLRSFYLQPRDTPVVLEQLRVGR